MNMHRLCSWRSPRPVAMVALVALVALAWSAPSAFCGEIHDAARTVTWKKSRRFSKPIPIWFPVKTTAAGRLCMGGVE